MFHAKTTATAALIALLATPLAAGVDKVAKIDATVDVSAINNAQAATFWANLEADLENAIAARVTERLAVEEVKPDDQGRIDGAQIKVDVREVELASAFERELNMGDAVLVGQAPLIVSAQPRHLLELGELGGDALVALVEVTAHDVAEQADHQREAGDDHEGHHHLLASREALEGGGDAVGE